MANIGKDSEGDEIINIDAVVGLSGANQKNDILAVEALLKYFKDGSTAHWTSQNLTDPDGSFDASTRQAIYDFQAYVRRTAAPNYWVSLDGRISPFKAGVQLLNKQEWTIIALNNHCGMIAAARGEGDHVNAICRRWPFTVGMMLNRFLFL
jgi:hypothetical protein